MTNTSLYKNVEITDKKVNTKLNDKGLLKRHDNGLRFIEEYLKSDYKILDIGAREGMFLQKLKDNGYNNLYGIDISEKAIKELNKRSGISGSVEDMHNLPFEYDSYNFIVCTHTLEHSHDPNQAISEMKRVLIKGGFLFVEVPIEKRKEPKIIAGHFYCFRSEQEVVEMIETNDFTIIKTETNPNPKKHYFRILAEYK